jgi:hypothetical protein
LPSIVRIIKSRKMKWAGHIAFMGEIKNPYRILVRKPEGRNYLEDLGIDERIILKMVLRKSCCRL